MYIRCMLNNILAVTSYETTVVCIADTLLFESYDCLIQIIFAECLQSSPMVSNVSDANCLFRSYE